jgi:uncharacterized cupin superfamily protein
LFTRATRHSSIHLRPLGLPHDLAAKTSTARPPDQAIENRQAGPTLKGDEDMPGSIVVVAADAARLEHSPFRPGWIQAGTPEARATTLARSHDATCYIMAWECSAGEFVWHYAEDETVVVLSGEAFVTNDAGAECRLAEGHVAFFPGGSSSRWRVTRPIKKIAVLRQDLPPLLGFGVRAWHKFLRLLGLRGGPALTPASSSQAVSA